MHGTARFSQNCFFLLFLFIFKVAGKYLIRGKIPLGEIGPNVLRGVFIF